MKPRPTIRIIGIDPGSRATGYGVVDHSGSEIRLVAQGTIRPKAAAGFPERLQTIFDGLCEVIERTRPDVAAVETPFSGLNPRSLIQLAHARGVILLAARKHGLEVFEYSPRSVKSAVVGYGGAEKHQVATMVSLLVTGLAKEKMSSDAADAVAIAICHAHTAGSPKR